MMGDVIQFPKKKQSRILNGFEMFKPGALSALFASDYEMFKALEELQFLRRHDPAEYLKRKREAADDL